MFAMQMPCLLKFGRVRSGRWSRLVSGQGLGMICVGRWIRMRRSGFGVMLEISIGIPNEEHTGAPLNKTKVYPHTETWRKLPMHKHDVVYAEFFPWWIALWIKLPYFLGISSGQKPTSDGSRYPILLGTFYSSSLTTFRSFLTSNKTPPSSKLSAPTTFIRRPFTTMCGSDTLRSPKHGRYCVRFQGSRLKSARNVLEKTVWRWAGSFVVWIVHRICGGSGIPIWRRYLSSLLVLATSVKLQSPRAQSPFLVNSTIRDTLSPFTMIIHDAKEHSNTPQPSLQAHFRTYGRRRFIKLQNPRRTAYDIERFLSLIGRFWILYWSFLGLGLRWWTVLGDGMDVCGGILSRCHLSFSSSPSTSTSRTFNFFLTNITSDKTVAVEYTGDYNE
ncbi:hypothetical protein D9758_015896 [Tetrapyrgos nigripes]|uniref:Uncharacterized protein n=1 Tax=Tetrapyrgos nigripes TaxID=182062 RepID=A0A8H5FPF6_9AGAR|nr:hypothetical protein D9758_015896 [Tetrapyrgos nigripes]